MNQNEFDFAAAERERPITEHFARLEALAAEEFSEENRCLAWVTSSDGRAWKDWWQNLPSYERNGMLVDYREERGLADRIGEKMRSYDYLRNTRDILVAQDEEIAQSWALELKKAAVERRPIPYSESEDMTGFERVVFKIRLARAFEIAGVVIVQAPAEQPTKSRRRRT